MYEELQQIAKQRNIPYTLLCQLFEVEDKLKLLKIKGKTKFNDRENRKIEEALKKIEKITFPMMINRPPSIN